MRSLFLISDGIGYRNLALGGVLERVAAVSDVHVLHVLPDNAVRLWEARCRSLTWSSAPMSRGTPAEIALGLVLKDAHWRASGTKAHRWKRQLAPTGRWHGRWMTRAARVVGHFTASPSWIRRVSAWHLRMASRNPTVDQYQRLFQDLRPDVVVCSNQLMDAFLAPVLAARSVQIPTVAFIASWDNLTAKEPILAPFDHYLVWSRLMREQLLSYYPHIKPANVHVVGTPQFDLYARPELLWPRREFCQQIGADPGRPVICYSGAATCCIPDEHLYLKGLLDLIRLGRIRNRPQVVFRRNPWDWTRHHTALEREYPELIVAEPRWEATPSRKWTEMVPLPDDARLMANLVHHAELNINIASTMSIDFAICDKPVVNIAFDVSNPPPLGIHLWEHFYQWEHYRPVWQMGAVRLARSFDELAMHVNAYLDDPMLDREARRRLVELEVGVPLGHSSSRVADVLVSLASRRGPQHLSLQ